MLPPGSVLLDMSGPLLRLYVYRAEKAGPSSAEVPGQTPLDPWNLIHMPTAKKSLGPMLAPMVPSLAIFHLSLSSRVLCASLGADSSDNSQCRTRTLSLDSAFLKRQRWPFFQAEPAARSDLLSRAYTCGLLSNAPLPIVLRPGVQLIGPKMPSSTYWPSQSMRKIIRLGSSWIPWISVETEIHNWNLERGARCHGHRLELPFTALPRDGTGHCMVPCSLPSLKLSPEPGPRMGCNRPCLYYFFLPDFPG